MNNPIIKTEQLSMDTCKALLKTMVERIAVESCQINYWKKKSSVTNTCLSTLAMKDLVEKRNSLKQQYIRLYKRVNESQKNIK